VVRTGEALLERAELIGTSTQRERIGKPTSATSRVRERDGVHMKNGAGGRDDRRK
jgi:hypothetical protein